MATPQPTKQSRELSNAMYDDWKRKVGAIPAWLLLSITLAMDLPSMHCMSTVACCSLVCPPPTRMGRLVSIPCPPRKAHTCMLPPVFSSHVYLTL